MKATRVIYKDVKVGIFDSEYIARIYKDKIIVTFPYVKWVGNTGGYAEYKQSIRDQKTFDRIVKELNDGCETTAWKIIGNYFDDAYLEASL